MTSFSGLIREGFRSLRGVAIGLALAFCGAGQAQAVCLGSDMLTTGLVNNICWDCVFPLRISGITIFDTPMELGGADENGFTLSSRPGVPPGAADDIFCFCEDGPLPTAGVPLGMWLPSTIYEATLDPGCSSVLGGVQIGIADPLYRGTEGDPTHDMAQQSFNHVHLYSYPILALMELFSKCDTQFSDIDVLYMSEIDPMWSDPIVSLYGNPLSVFGASLPAQAACMADAVAANLGEPMDAMFWCGGSWTTTTSPYTGFEHALGPVQYSSATALKLLAMNAARGITRDKRGNDALCGPDFEPMIQRAGYRWQSVWPSSEGRNHGTGESVMRWGAGRTVPGIADLPIYMLWEWTDCCSTIVGGP